MPDRLAIDGGRPVRTTPFHPWPVFDEREERALLEVLHSGKWGVHVGTRVSEFERRFASFQGTRHAVAVPNGTQALELGLRALGVGPGDEVITSPYTFIATANAAITVGARPVFVDIEADSFNIDPGQIEAAITPRTKALLPVHIAGRPANMDAVLEIAGRYGLPVLEDACQAWGAEWRGRRTGSMGDLGAFSFQASKNISSGEGGAIVTNRDDLYQFCWSYHTVGRVQGGAWYQHEIVAGNMRLPEWEGAILLVQLERLPEHEPRREANARYLAELLHQVGGLAPLLDDPRITSHARHLFIARYDAAAFGGRSRQQFLDALRAEGVTDCAAGYTPLYQTPAIARWLAANNHSQPPCPVTEEACGVAVWLPQSVLLGPRSDMDSIAEAVAKIKAAWG